MELPYHQQQTNTQIKQIEGVMKPRSTRLPWFWLILFLLSSSLFGWFFAASSSPNQWLSLAGFTIGSGVGVLLGNLVMGLLNTLTSLGKILAGTVILALFSAIVLVARSTIALTVSEALPHILDQVSLRTLVLGTFLGFVMTTLQRQIDRGTAVGTLVIILSSVAIITINVQPIAFWPALVAGAVGLQTARMMIVSAFHENQSLLIVLTVWSTGLGLGWLTSLLDST